MHEPVALVMRNVNAVSRSNLNKILANKRRAIASGAFDAAILDVWRPEPRLRDSDGLFSRLHDSDGCLG